MTGFTAKSFDLLQGLTDDNSKDWYDAHRDEMKTWLLDPFAQVLGDISDRLSDAATPLRGGPKTMFRMNRDVRFSKDKSPYKTAVAGLLTPSGTKSEMAGVVYLQLGADGGLVAGGWHQPDTPALTRLRDRILSHKQDFDGMVAGLDAAGLSLSDDDSLTRMPRGFEDHADAPHAAALKRKTLIVHHPLPKSAWLDGDVVQRVAGFARHLDGLFAFGAAALR